LHPRCGEVPPPGEGFDRLFMSASLDHAIWFHRPPVADRWHLHDFTSHGLLGSRGLSVGHVVTDEGVHLATIAQEILLRTRH
jgi:acyl-CoA thioesterase II